MQFTKANDVYRIVRITGYQDNILGVTLAEEEIEIDVLPWGIEQESEIQTTASQVLEQLSSGLGEINLALNKKYYLSKVYFLPSDSASNSVYSFLIKELIKRIDSGGEFFEILESSKAHV